MGLSISCIDREAQRRRRLHLRTHQRGVAQRSTPAGTSCEIMPMAAGHLYLPDEHGRPTVRGRSRASSTWRSSMRESRRRWCTTWPARTPRRTRPRSCLNTTASCDTPPAGCRCTAPRWHWRRQTPQARPQRPRVCRLGWGQRRARPAAGPTAALLRRRACPPARGIHCESSSNERNSMRESRRRSGTRMRARTPRRTSPRSWSRTSASCGKPPAGCRCTAPRWRPQARSRDLALARQPQREQHLRRACPPARGKSR